MYRFRRTLIVALTLLGSACAGDKSTGPQVTPTISISTSAATQAVARGASVTTDITLARGGAYASAVTLTAENLPAGVTATFAPSSLTGSVVASTVTIAAGVSAALGAAAVTIRASGVGVTTKTVTLNLTVEPPPITINSTGSSFTVSRGGTASVALAISRFNAPGLIALTAENLPSGVTASFAPNAVADSSAILTLTASAGATLGATAVTIRGVIAGGASGTAPLPLTVAAPGSGGSIAWRFCDTVNKPAWVAFRDGTSGAFTRAIEGPNATYQLTVTADVGVVASVITAFGYPYGELTYASVSELAELGATPCYVAPSRKSLTVTVANVAAPQSARIWIGDDGATTSTSGTPIALNLVREGQVNLLADRSIPDAGDAGRAPDRIIVRRSVNYAAGSSVPLLDFGSAEAFAPSSATLTIANTDGGTLGVGTAFATALGGAVSLGYAQLMGLTSTDFVRYGVPTAQLLAGDYHVTTVNQFRNTPVDYRYLVQYNRELLTRTITLGPALTPPTLTTLTTVPYARLQASGSWQTEYGYEVEFVFTQSGASLNEWTIDGRSSYFGLGASTYAFEIPDLSGVAGFSTAWGPRSGVQTSVAARGRSAPLGAFGEGAAVRGAQAEARTITP